MDTSLEIIGKLIEDNNALIAENQRVIAFNAEILKAIAEGREKDLAKILAKQHSGHAA